MSHAVPPPPFAVNRGWARGNTVPRKPPQPGEAPVSNQSVSSGGSNSSRTDNATQPSASTVPFVAHDGILDFFGSPAPSTSAMGSREPSALGTAADRGAAHDEPSPARRSDEGGERVPTPSAQAIADAFNTVPPGSAAPASGASRILQFLYLGSVDDAQDAEFLRSANVRLILNVSNEAYWTADPTIRVLKFEAPDRSDFDIMPIVRKALPVLTAAKETYARRKGEILAARLASLTGHARPAVGGTSVESGGALGDTLAGNDDIRSGSDADADAEGPGAGSAEKPELPPSVLVHCQQGVSRSATVVLAYLMQQNGWGVEETLDFVQQRRPRVSPNMGFMGQLAEFFAQLSAKGDAVYDRKLLKQRLVLLLRHADAPDDTVRAVFEPYGDVYRVERKGTALTCVWFATRMGRRWAQQALAASLELRQALSTDPAKPAQIVPLPALTGRSSRPPEETSPNAGPAAVPRQSTEQPAALS